MTGRTVIRVGRAAEAFAGRGLLLDGTSARPARVTLTIDEAARALMVDGTPWPLADLRRLPDMAGDDLVLRRADDPVQRLTLTHPDDIEIVTRRAP
ncbi:MAG: DUF7092 domain-containing protein, partial [Shimia sp.]